MPRSPMRTKPLRSSAQPLFIRAMPCSGRSTMPRPTTTSTSGLMNRPRSVMKWPVPILSATRVEWVPQVQSDLFVLGRLLIFLPPHLELRCSDSSGAGSRWPSSADSEGVDESLLRLRAFKPARPRCSESSQLCAATSRAPDIVKNVPLPASRPTASPESGTASADARVIYTVAGFPASDTQHQRRQADCRVESSGFQVDRGNTSGPNLGEHRRSLRACRRCA